MEKRQASPTQASQHAPFLQSTDAINSSQSSQPPTKTRRNARACLNCRSRKQKCPQPVPEDGLRAPCIRCQQLSLRCSFEVDPVPGLDSGVSPSKVVEYILDLQRRLHEHEGRILRLEGTGTNHVEDPGPFTGLVDDLSVPYDQEVGELQTREFDTPQGAVSPGQEIQSTGTTNFSMNNVALESPFATLRSMGENSQGKNLAKRGVTIGDSRTTGTTYGQDPISRGILTSQEALKCIEIYFNCCHPHAPFMNESFRQDFLSIRSVSPAVFSAICSISTRFWEKIESPHSTSGWNSHPRIFELISLFDDCISRLLLRPLPSDVNLDSVQALLLYVQWMPYNEKRGGDDPLRTSSRHESPKSRYNDISAWAVLGMAARYAKLLHLQRESPPVREGNKPGQDHSTRLRTYCNLISCDFNLMLSSGLPVSIDPTSTQQSIRELASDQHAQLPGDLRVTGLIELVSLTYQALARCGDFSGRKMDPKSLKALNTDFDVWERSWITKLNHTRSQHNQLPFTSVRWYRLTLNSAFLVPLLSSDEKAAPHRSQLLHLQCLEVGLTAACQIIFSHASTAEEYIWNIESQQPSTFPDGSFRVDPEALQRMQYAVDSAWISYTFAVTFLVLCFVRRTVDDDLQLCHVNPASTLGPCHPSRPRSDSIISRLLRLALDVSDGMQHFSSFCPGRDFRRIIENAASLVGVTNKQTGEDAMVTDAAMQSILDLIHDSGLEWPEPLYGFESNTNNDWGF